MFEIVRYKQIPSTRIFEYIPEETAKLASEKHQQCALLHDYPYQMRIPASDKTDKQKLGPELA